MVLISIKNLTHSVVTSMANKLQLDKSLFTLIFSRLVFEFINDAEFNSKDLEISSISISSSVLFFFIMSYNFFFFKD